MRDNWSDKFWDKVAFIPFHSCWEWIGAKRCKRGYGGFHHPDLKKDVLATRFIYEKLIGPIPYKMVICHKCDNPKCIRPEHLFLGSQKDNMIDAQKKGRLFVGRPNSIKTHCKQGHLLSEDNLLYFYVDKRRLNRRCKLCCYAYQKKWRLNKTIKIKY